MSMKYTESHEWVNVQEKKGRVGITCHAQKELGEVVYLQLPKVGDELKVGQEAAVLESTKAAIDVYSPVSGTVVAVNKALEGDISLINNEPEKGGWLYEVELSSVAELELLLEQAAYQALVTLSP
ncbi:MAG: glycine cleavage system protein GcvH [Chlamydiales bacterium]|nr:glycine cleavage system protein GcvH [Chlamydiales bacterium]